MGAAKHIKSYGAFMKVTEMLCPIVGTVMALLYSTESDGLSKVMPILISWSFFIVAVIFFIMRMTRWHESRKTDLTECLLWSVAAFMSGVIAGVMYVMTMKLDWLLVIMTVFSGVQTLIYAADAIYHFMRWKYHTPWPEFHF